MLNVWAIEVEEGCEVRQGETVDIDYNDMSGWYKGTFMVTGIAITHRIEISVENDEGNEAWLPIDACEW
tara:strand:- start:217 stop:423 length:207 start_codon:yes stop_codon:yes gene_type:complete